MREASLKAGKLSVLLESRADKDQSGEDMTEMIAPTQTTPKFPIRIGVLFADLGALNITVLKYLVVHLNTLQSSFEFELHTMRKDDPLLTLLSIGKIADREKCRKMLPGFYGRTVAYIIKEQAAYGLQDTSLPEGLVLITRARFSDEHYGLKEGPVQVQALGEWERSMAPPSIFEFILTLLIRQAASFAAASVSRSLHLGTKGCLFDFTGDLGDARYKALQSYVCKVCQTRLQEAGALHILPDILKPLDMSWLGKVVDPYSPSGIVAKLGYNLFLTQGIKPSLWETIRGTLRDEGTKELLKLVSALVLAGLLVWLGWKR